MTIIPVHRDDALYLKVLKSNGPKRTTTLGDSELKALPRSVLIITGNKTKDFGGGPSPDGFVMNGAEMLGRLRIEGRVKNGVITVI